MKTRLFALLTVLSIGLSAMADPSTITGKQVDEALKRLDKELAQRDRYKQMRQNRIDSLKELRIETTVGDSLWFATTLKIADAYNTFNVDSALIYYSQGLETAEAMGDAALTAAFRGQNAAYLALAGYVYDALKEFDAIDPSTLTPEQLQQYYISGRQMYSYISGYYSSFVHSYDYWNSKALEMHRLLLGMLDRNSPYFRFHEGEYLYNNHEPGRARIVLLSTLDMLNEDNHAYAIVCNLLAKIAKERGDMNEYKYYLAQSAISDVRTATLEVVSLQELGSHLSEERDTERAHKYLSVALSNAVESHASIRMLQTSELLNLVEAEHLREVASYRRQVNIGVTILLVLVISLVIAMASLRKQIKSLSTTHSKLRTANRTKEVYISQFVTLCSIYMDKLREFSKTATRKLSAGQSDDLLRIVKSGKFVEDQSREFFAAFDDAFLHIYPHFVSDVNKLLLPEERIDLKNNEQLNTDLRILAFMRLGLDDPARIAGVLNYSVNTIYAYRTKLRRKAINPDTFERDLMKISSI